MTKYKFKLPIIILTFVVALTSCNGEKKQIVETKEAEVIPENIVELREDQVKLANIEIGAIELRSMSGTLKVNGIVSVAPQNLATVSMPMGGFVKNTNLMPGNAVRKGQTLAIIENQEFIDLQQNYLEAINKFELAKEEYNRQSELYKSDISSQKNMQQVTSNYNSLKVQVKALEQKLSLVGINPSKLNEDNMSRSVALVSPITGYVKAVNVSIGKSVSASDILFEIVNSDKLFLELTLFEKDADKVSNGEKIRFFINNETEQHEALIYQTGKSINNDRTYKVYANVVGHCKNIIPGMYVNAHIQAKSNQVTSVPSTSIVSFDDKDYIFVFEKNKVESGKPFTEYRMVQIQKDVSDEEFTEIVLPEGFNFEKAKVVVKGAYNLLSAKENAGEMGC
ncbi:MAG: efflux RND transporter periplasmic adaptor subunit [Dysgonamonadaceae bacterium]|nr:efflux RND transporter periplasmic adaptor subunit [Dysgonamonadaceae bacterium]MDD3309894.1 efflux RND transporter periplasmic adaptor subunit [Dysgonamonadaceae bacterium]MDD3901157.1 efflux RND transporter periplasmic adaptor subunit [Dysgonamonadaceae bacterium]MDD4399479.1 efflux RND transporter periplasmic adaptor subunit [Dysgonamonadaceae bacterium]